MDRVGAGSRGSRRAVLARLAIVGVLAANLVVSLLAWRAPVMSVPVPVEGMGSDGGHAYIGAIDVRPPFPYVARWDTLGAPQAATATLLEDGRPLGPPHAQHADIRNAGAGRFSFWAGGLHFSASDGTDPRVNGRRYTARFEARLPYRVTLGLLALDILAAVAFRRSLPRLLARYGGVLVWIAVLAFAVRVGSAVAGLAPDVFASTASPIDGALVLSILAHVALGFGLAALTVTVGVGALLWLRQGDRGFLDVLLRAFLPGTVVIAIAALLAVAVPGGPFMAVVLCGVVAAPAVRLRPDRRAVGPAAKAALAGAPVIALYALVLSFRLHGPSGTLAGAPYGDETIYVGWANMLARHVMPLYNFANEGVRTSYGNIVPSLLEAPLLGFRWFDPYLFFSAGLPVMGLWPLCAMVPTLRQKLDEGRRFAPRVPDAWIAAGLMAGMFRNPGAIVESPPFAMLLPIVATTVFLSLDRRPGARPWQAVVTAAAGTAVSKVVAFAVLVPMAAPQLVHDLARRASRRQRVAAAILGAVAVGYVALALRTYLPTFMKVGSLGPNSWDAIVRYHVTDPLALTCVVARDLGAVVLMVGVIGSAWRGLKVGVSIGVASFLAVPFLFHTTLTTASLATALALLSRPELFERARMRLAFAAVLMLPQTILAEEGGTAVALAWFAVVAVLADIRVAAASSEAVPGPGRRSRLLPLAAAALIGVASWGAASRAMNVGPERLDFTPALRDIWLAVRRLTPPGALIFTDQTGDTESRLGGWNDFALLGQRQFYLVSWSASPLRMDADLRRAWLSRNDAVLSGAVDPERLDLSRPYDGFYAVLSKDRRPPPRARLVYSNSGYSLFQLPSDDRKPDPSGR